MYIYSTSMASPWCHAHHVRLAYCWTIRKRVLLNTHRLPLSSCTVAQELTKSCGCWKPLKITWEKGCDGQFLSRLKSRVSLPDIMNYTMSLENDNGESVEKISTVFTSPRAALALGIYRIKTGTKLNLYIQEMRPKKLPRCSSPIRRSKSFSRRTTTALLTSWTCFAARKPITRNTNSTVVRTLAASKR